ncbi:MAG: hypothetical protein LBB79_10070 [Prevotellaceae bacterium]|jgi:hypothetical protein|nr:hypothetical protein [Prevotellaceae bacterium]
MKKSTKRDKAHATAHVAEHKSRNRIICTSELVPLELMEKPDSAKAMQWKNTGMPSDFWL